MDNDAWNGLKIVAEAFLPYFQIAFYAVVPLLARQVSRWIGGKDKEQALVVQAKFEEQLGYAAEQAVRSAEEWARSRGSAGPEKLKRAKEVFEGVARRLDLPKVTEDALEDLLHAQLSVNREWLLSSKPADTPTEEEAEQ